MSKPLGGGDIVGLMQRKSYFGVDVGKCHVLTALEPRIQCSQHRGGSLARFRFAFDRDEIAAHRHADAEPLLDPHQMFLVRAPQRGQALIVGKFERHLFACRRTLRGARGQCITIERACSTKTSSPFRLFGRTSVIHTSSIVPMREAAPST